MAGQIDQRRWLTAYLSEIERVARLTPNRVLNTVFFGGGTPSLMEPEIVAAILERIQTCWRPANDLEITLEANPGSVEAGRFRAYADGGVNRISMGVQALNDRDLQRLGRMHSLADARRAFDIARNTFDRVSFDLIYARQDQTLADWHKELSEALTMAVDHFSLYQLTIEDGTVFGARAAAGRLKGLPADDAASDMYLATQDICDQFGLPGYEVSNHARPGAESRHNLIYWRYGDYGAIGPGAHGRLTLNGQRLATEAPRAPGLWLSQVEARGSGDGTIEGLTPEDQATELLLMGLRLREGIDAARFEGLAGRALPDAALRHLEDIGMITLANGRVTATRAGRPVLNAILRELLA